MPLSTFRGAIDMSAKKNTPQDAFPIFIGEGTLGTRILMQAQLVAAQYGRPLRHGVDASFIYFDGELPAPPEVEREWLEESGLLTSHASFVEAKLPDRESLERHHHRLWFLDEESLRNPGVRSVGAGSGNNPAWGNALYRLNDLRMQQRMEQAIRTAQSHCRKREAVVKGDDDAEDRPIHVTIALGTAGGIGNGAVVESCRQLRHMEARLQVRIHITIFLVDIGTLHLINHDVAKRNRARTLNYLRAVATGNYMDPEGLNDFSGRPLFDNIIVCWNAGPHSELPTLDEQEAFAAHQLFLLHCSPMGRRIRERMVDLDGNRGVDDCNAPRAASAMGFFRLALDRSRYRQYCGAATGRALAAAVLDAPAGDGADEGSKVISDLQLIESDSESQAVGSLTKADVNDPDAFQEARGALEDRAAEGTSWRKFMGMVEGYRVVGNDLIDRIILPRVGRRGSEMVQSGRRRLSACLVAWGKHISGLNYGVGLLQGALAELEKSSRSNAEKRSLLADMSQPLFQEIDACHREFERLSRRSWFGRIFRVFSIGRLCHRYEQLAKRCLVFRLELAVRDMIQGDVYLPFMDFLRERLAALLRMQGKLQGAMEDLERRAETVTQSGVSALRVPVGINVDDARALRDFHARHLKARGGTASLVEHLVVALLERSGTLFGFLECSQEEIATRTSDLALQPFEAAICSLNVLDVLRQRHGRRVGAILDMAVKESAPRIRTVGEANQNIPCIRVIGAPTGSDWEWLRGEFRTINQAPDEWIKEDLPPEADSVLFLTYRSQISLTMLIDQHPVSKSGLTARERIAGMPDPLAALLPVGEMTEDDARIAALYALACGMLSYDDETGWVIEDSQGHRSVGRSAEGMLRALRTNFPDVVRIYSALGRLLQRQGENLRRELADGALFAQPEARAALTDAIRKRAMDEIDEVLPYFKHLERDA